MRTRQPSEKIIENKRTRERNRQALFYHQRKSEGLCVDCGLQTDFMSVCDFHHKDAETKSDRVAELISHYRSWEIVQAELDKCILLCSNSHRIRHELEDNASIF